MLPMKNPYLSNDSDQFLLRKNFNVLKSPKKSLFSTDQSPSIRASYGLQTPNHKNNENYDYHKRIEKLSLKNPFATREYAHNNNQNSFASQKVLKSYNSTSHTTFNSITKVFPTENLIDHQNLKNDIHTHYNANTNSRSLQSKQKPLSVSNKSLRLSNVSIDKHLEVQRLMSPAVENKYTLKSLNGQYEWDRERWKRQQERESRIRLRQYGPDALRYEAPSISNYNHEYYSMNHLPRPKDNSKQQFLEDHRMKSPREDHRLPQQSSHAKKLPIKFAHKETFSSSEEDWMRGANSHRPNLERKSSSVYSLSVPQKNSFGSETCINTVIGGSKAAQNPDPDRKSRHIDFQIEEDEFENIESKMEAIKEQSRFEPNNSMMSDYNMEAYKSRNLGSNQGPLNVNAFDTEAEESNFLFRKGENSNFLIQNHHGFRSEESNAMLDSGPRNSAKGGRVAQRDLNRRSSVKKTTFKTFAESDYPTNFQYQGRQFFRIQVKDA